MIDLKLLASIFGVIFVAELPDKTALATLVLATRHKPWPVFVGAASALTVQSLVAILAGTLLSYVPHRWVEIASGLLFLVFAVMMWRRKEEAEEDKLAGKEPGPVSFGRVAWTVFVVVFLAEWGDLTQLATGTLAAHYRAPVTIFLGATLALWSVAAIATFAGNRAGKLLDPHRTQKIAAVIFAAIGVALLAGWL